MGMETFTCEYCPYVSQSQKGIRMHMGRSHKDQITERTCDGCHNRLPITAFKWNAANKVYTWKCRPCAGKAERAARTASRPASHRRRDHKNNIKRRFGITPEEWDTFVAAHPTCAICGTKEDLVIDHCHETGKLRGRLCRIHNAGLGMLDDSVETLQAAIDYLLTAVNKGC